MPEASKQTENCTKQEIQSFAGGRGRRFFHQSIVLPWIVTGLATDLGQVKKAQLTCIFCCRFQATKKNKNEFVLSRLCGGNMK